MKGVPPEDTVIVTFVGRGLQKPTKVKAVVIDSDLPGKFKILETIEEGSMGGASPGTIHRGLVNRLWWHVEEEDDLDSQ